MSSSPSPQSNRWAPLLFVVLWSTGFIGAKLGLPHAQPLSFLLVRYLLVISLMTGLAFAMHAPWPTDARHWLHIGVSGLLVHGIYLGGVFKAIALGLPAGVASLIVGLQPLLTAIGAGWVLGERVIARQWIGLLLGFVGVLLVVSGKMGVGGFALSAVGAALIALVGITVGTLYQKKFCPRFDWRSGAVAQFVPTAIATAIIVTLTEDFRIAWVPEFVFALGWLVLVLSLGAISLLNGLIRRGSAVNMASVFYLVPPTTALIAWLLFNETLSGLALVGMALAIGGVYLAQQRAAA